MAHPAVSSTHESPLWAKFTALGGAALLAASAYMTNQSTAELVSPDKGVAIPELPAFVVHPNFQAVVKGGNPCQTGQSAYVFNLIELNVETIQCAAKKPLEIFTIDSRPMDEADIDNMAAARTAWRRIMGPNPLPAIDSELEKQKRFMAHLMSVQQRKQSLGENAL